MRLGSRKLSISLLVVLFGSLAMLLSACGGGSSNSGPTNLAKDQTLNIAWPTGSGTDITGLDPGTSSDTSSIPIVEQIFDGLVTLDQNLKVENWAASSIDVSTDGKTYTFHLRPGMQYSDGTPVKASDYAAAMDRSENPCLASGVNYYLWSIHDASTFAQETCDSKGNITAASGQTTPVITTLVGDSIVADDSAGTLKVTLDQPAGYFLAAMTYSTSYAIEKSVLPTAAQDPTLGADGKWNDKMTQGATGQGGSGMFYLAQWDHKSIVQLKANPNWWGVKAGKKPFLTTINYKLYASADTAYADYQSSSSVDTATITPASLVAAAQGQPDFHKTSLLEFENIQFNWKIAPFDNKDARLAFCLAVNRDVLNTSISKGLNTPMWNIVPPGMPGYQANFKGPDGAGTGDNTAAAQQHWAAYKASLNGAAVPQLVYNFNPSSQSAINRAQAIVGMWNQTLFGGQPVVTTNSNDWKSALKLEHAGKLQMFRFGWLADYPDPQDFLTLLFSSDSSYNWQNSSVPQADSLMKQADGIYQPSQQAQRIQLYNQAERLLVDNVATCPLYTGNTYYRTRTYVHGYDLTAQGQPSLDDWAQTYIMTH